MTAQSFRALLNSAASLSLKFVKLIQRPLVLLTEISQSFGNILLPTNSGSFDFCSTYCGCIKIWLLVKNFYTFYLFNVQNVAEQIFCIIYTNDLSDIPFFLFILSKYKQIMIQYTNRSLDTMREFPPKRVS